MTNAVSRSRAAIKRSPLSAASIGLLFSRLCLVSRRRGDASRAAVFGPCCGGRRRVRVETHDVQPRRRRDAVGEVHAPSDTGFAHPRRAVFSFLKTDVKRGDEEGHRSKRESQNNFCQVFCDGTSQELFGILFLCGANCDFVQLLLVYFSLWWSWKTFTVPSAV